VLREALKYSADLLFAPSSLYFAHTPSKQSIHIHPYPLNEPHGMKYYSLAGRLLALALYNRVSINVKLSRALARRLLYGKQDNVYEDMIDLQDYDPDTYQTFSNIINRRAAPQGQPDMKEADELVDMTFVASYVDKFGSHMEVALEKNGEHKAVTDRNLLQFIHKYIDFKLFHNQQQQLNALIQGFTQVLSRKALHYLSVDDMIHLLQGAQKVNVDELMSTLDLCDGLARTTPVITWFEKWMRDIATDSQKIRQLFMFWSGAEPPLSFSECHEDDRFTIEKISGLSAGALPKAATCSRVLYLPPFKNEAEFRHKIEQAISLGFLGFSET